MAVIGAIQKRIWIVFVFIGIALIGFLIMDSTQSSQGTLGRGGQSTEFAAIGDQEIEPREYQESVGRTQNQYLVQQQAMVDYVQGNYELDEATKFQIREQAWNQLINTKLIEQHAGKAPLTVTEDEWANMVYGTDPHPMMRQIQQLMPNMGINPSQPGAMQQFKQFISDQQQYEQFPVLMQYNMDFMLREQAVKESRLGEKYVDILQKGVYTPAWLASRDYQMQNTRLDLDYIMLPYRDIEDDAVSFTEAEVQAKYKKMLPTFTKQERTGNIAYVAFDVVPTSGDSAEIRQKVREYTQQWQRAESDSIFLTSRSQDQYAYTGAWLTRDNLNQLMVDSAQAETVFNTPVDSFTDLYREGGAYKVAKVLRRATYPDSTHLRHIFLRFNEPGDSVAKRPTIDSIFAVLKAGEATFEELAARHSEDESNAQNGGDLDWINPNTGFFPVLRQYIYRDADLNDPQIVASPIGYHIMEVLEKRNEQVHIKHGVLALNIRPSRETDDVAYAKAETFYETYGFDNNEEQFDNGVAEGGYQKRISGTFRENQYAIPNLPLSRAVIDWALNEDTEEGAIRLFSLPNKHIVARVIEQTQPGEPTLEKVRTQVESALINEKKAEQLEAKAQEALASAGGDLSAAADNLGVTVNNAQGATFGQNFIPKLGAEPDVLGVLFGLDMNETSEPIAGKQGVYVVKPTNITQADELPDYAPVRNRIASREKNRLGVSNLLESLKESSEITDNHRSFNL